MSFDAHLCDAISVDAHESENLSDKPVCVAQVSVKLVIIR